jgi:hypothetical protein
MTMPNDDPGIEGDPELAPSFTPIHRPPAGNVHRVGDVSDLLPGDPVCVSNTLDLGLGGDDQA